MTAVAGVAGVLLGLTGRLIEGDDLPRAPDWWRRRESGVFLRKLPASALAGLGPGGVDVRSGQLLCNVARRRDVVPAGPLALGFDRIYDSRIEEAGCLGPGWRTRWDVTLRVQGESLVYRDEWGRALTVPRPEPGTQVIVAAASLNLACLEDGQYVIADAGPACMRFLPADEAGTCRLDALEFLDGRLFTIARDPRGAIQSVSNERGAGLWFDLDDAGRIRAVARGPQSEPSAVYAYGTDGRLSRVESSRGKPIGRYGYQDGMLADIAEAAGDRSIRWLGSDAGPQVAGLRLPGGRMWLVRREPQARRVRMQASDGAELHWHVDAQGRVVAYRDAQGAVYKAHYDKGSRLARVDAPDGAFEFEYDGFGRVVRETAPHGRVRRVGYAFSTSIPLMLSREGARNWFWLRDSHLRPQQRRAPGGVITDYEYDPETGARRVVRQNGVATRHGHDDAGRLLVREGADGAQFRYAWTDDGQLRARGGPGHPLEVRERDDVGNLKVRVGDGTRARLAVYDAGGRLVSLANAAGHARHWRYDVQGALAQLTDEEGATTRHARDATGHGLEVQGPGGGTQRWIMDAGRRAWARRDADGVTIERRLDVSGRVTHQADIAGTMRADTEFGYDAQGRLASRERAGLRWAFEHDDHGRLAEVRAEGDGGTSRLVFAYDAHGRVVGETGERGTLQRHIDDQGHVAAYRLPCGLALYAARDPGQRAVQLSYALEGETVTLATLVYDGAGRETMRIAGGVQRDIVIDETAGTRSETSARVVGGFTRVDGLDRSERRDAAGRLVEESDALGRRLYDYDRRGQLVRSLGEAGMVYTTWDAGGNVIALDSAGWAPPSPAPDHRPARVGRHVLAYDPWGRVLRRDGPLSRASFEWDAAGRLIQARENGVAVAYAYDAAGRLAARRLAQAGDGWTHRFVWDGLRLMQERTPLLRVTYLYAPARPGCLSYAPVARLIQRRPHKAAGWAAPQAQYLYVDAAGRVRAVLDGDGGVVWLGGIRAWGERIGPPVVDTPAPPGFAGHWMDPDVSICWNGRRFYDPLTARYLSPDRDAPPGVSPYRYVGAPAMQANPTGLAVGAPGVGARAGITIPERAPVLWAGALPPGARIP